MLGQVLADDGELEGLLGRTVFAGDPQKVRIAGIGIGRRHLRHADAIGPFYFERRRREE